MLHRLFRHAIKHGSRNTVSRVRAEAANFLARVTHKKFVKSDYSGILMSANWADITFNLCINAGYGHFYSEYLLKFGRQFLFLDIGANQGLYSLVAVKNPNCVQAFAFEPVASTFAILRKNVDKNGGRNVKVIEAGISSHTGTTEINIKSGHSGAASISQIFGVSNPATRQTINILNCEDLDRIVPRGKHSIVIKIDVEGHEKIVLEELIKCAFFHRVFSIFYEVDEAWCNPIELKRVLEKLGFSAFEKIGTGESHYDILASRIKFIQ